MQPLLSLLGAHGAAVYQLIKTSPLQRQTSANPRLQKKGDAKAETKPYHARGISVPDPTPRVTDSKVTMIWQYITVELASAAGACSHLALLSEGTPI